MPMIALLQNYAENCILLAYYTAKAKLTEEENGKGCQRLRMLITADNK